jgi:hypothetical protein
MPKFRARVPQAEKTLLQNAGNIFSTVMRSRAGHASVNQFLRLPEDLMQGTGENDA